MSNGNPAQELTDIVNRLPQPTQEEARKALKKLSRTEARGYLADGICALAFAAGCCYVAFGGTVLDNAPPKSARAASGVGVALMAANFVDSMRKRNYALNEYNAI